MKWWRWVIIAASAMVLWWSALIYAAYLFGVIVRQGVFLSGILVISVVCVALALLQKYRKTS